MTKTKPTKPRSARSLTTILALAFFTFSVVILLINGSFALYTNILTHQEALNSQQQHIAQDAADTVGKFVQDKFNGLEIAVELVNPVSVSTETQKTMMESLLGHDPAYRQFALLDSQGKQLVQVSRISQALSSQFIAQLKGDILLQTSKGQHYISPIYIDNATSEPLITIAIPVKNVFGDFQGSLVTEVNLKFMWTLVDQIKVGKTGYVYVVDNQGNLIAFKDTSRVLRGENVQQIPEVKEFIQNLSDPTDSTPEVTSYTGLLGGTVVGTYVPLGTPQWAVVTELPWQEAYQPVIQATPAAVVTILFFALLAAVAGVFMARRLAVPLVNLTETATRIASGEMGLQTTVNSGPREVIRLATAFNSMTAQLRVLIGSLEQRVVERTQELTGALSQLDEATRIAQLANYELEVTSQTLVLNDRFYELLGTTAATEGGYRQPISSVAQKFLHPADAPRMIEDIQNIGTGINPETGELNYRFRHTNGETRYFALRYSAERDAQDRILRLKGAAQDVTERQKVQESLREHEEDLNIMVESSPEAIGLVNVKTGLFENVNTAAEKLYGLPRVELEQVGPAQMSPEKQPNGRPSGEMAMEKIKEALEGGQPVFDWTHINSRKEPIPCEVRLVGLAGTRSHLVRFSVTNITQRKAAEEVIAKRAAELETVTQLSTSIASISDPQEMLQTLVDQVKQQFHFYHAHIYLLNDAGDTLQLTAGANEAGRQMVADKRTIALNREHSVVARAARSKRGVIVNDVAREPDFLPNPLLPNTKAELAVPLVVGATVLGVLDVQSDQVGYFTNEDLRIQTILAAQIATALQNARSFAQSEKSRQELDQLTRRLTREGWQSFVGQSSTQRLGFFYDDQQVKQLTEASPEFLANGHTVLRPITVRGETLGHLAAVEADKEEGEVAAVLEAVAQSLSSHLDNLRLSEQAQSALVDSQRRANELVVLNEMGRTLTNQREEADIYRTVYEYASRLMNTDTFYIATFDSQTQTVAFPISYNNSQPSVIPSRNLGKGLTDYIINKRQPLLMTNNVEEQIKEKNIDVVFFGGAKVPLSWVGVPIIYGDQILGVISAQSTTQPGLYREFERDLLTTVASQAAIAIENARSFQTTQRRAEREATINAISQKIQSATSVENAIQTAIEELGRTLNAKRTTVTMTPKVTDHGK